MTLRTIRAALWVAVGVAGVAFGVLLFLATAGPPTQPLSQGEPLGGSFALLDQHGAPVTEAALRSGRPSAVMFGFTYCPDVCPTTLMEMVGWKEELGEAANELGLVFVTVDPERDTPEVIKDYLAHFGENFVGLTGSREAVEAAAKAYRVYHAKIEAPESATDYNVDHSAIVYLMSPDGEYLAHFPYGTSAAAMAEGIRKHL